MTKIIDGTKIAEEIISKVKKKVENNKLKLRLSVVLVGNNKASLSYISQKEKFAHKAGIDFSLYRFPEKTKQQELIKNIEKISKLTFGLIVQLPLPKNLNDQEVLNSIPKEKDIDILSEDNLGKFYTGDFNILPPVVKAVDCILNKEKISVKGKNVAIIGAGKLVGKPLAVYLMKKKATVCVINEFTKNKIYFTKKSDIIISGVGKQNLIKSNMVKRNVIAIDAGFSLVNKKIKGDFSESVYKKALKYTKVPGGIGLITTACLIDNLIKINEH